LIEKKVAKSNKKMAEKIGKKELAEAIAKKENLPKAAATRILETLVEEITNGLKAGKKVALAGLGTFRVSQRKARTGRNPKTGETIQIPAKKAVKFRAAKELKEAVL